MVLFRISPSSRLILIISPRLYHTSPSLSYLPNHQQFKFRRAKLKRRLYNEHNQDSARPVDGLEKTQWCSDNENTILPTHSEDHKIEMENLFGVHPIFSALQAKRRTFGILYLRMSLYKAFMDSVSLHTKHPEMQAQILGRIWSEISRLNIPIMPVNKRKLDKLANCGVHQGLVLTVSSLAIQETNNHSLLISHHPGSVWILINKVCDPMNLGALIRTAVYFGVDKILISANCSRLSPVVSKASSGAMEFACMERVNDIERVIATLVDAGWEVVGSSCSSKSSVPLSDLSSHKKTLLIVGNEGHGIEEDVLSLCTKTVTISSGKDCPSLINSLNVSVAAGVLLNQLSSSRR
ncbi:rRNA methyltransferase 1, mitochondrial-like [Watersipora subatra]|uniref:rRNA methyltransferase 1, mitochondrial-like n=1 Tax=Watersipora subatra TaxID=2589382 RepID=UPI00355AD3B7